VPFGLIGYLLLPSLLGEHRHAQLSFAQGYLLAFLPVTFLAMNFLAIEQGQQRFSRFNLLRAVQAIAYPALLIVLWLANALNVINAALAVAFGTAVVAVALVWESRRYFGKTFSRSEAKAILKGSFRLHAVNVAMTLSQQIDKMVLIYFATNKQLGLYVAAFTAAAAGPSLIVQTYINVMLPVAAKAHPRTGATKSLVRSMQLLILAVAAASTGLAVLLPWLMGAVFGDDFRDAGIYAQVLVVGFAFIGLKKVLVYLLRSWHVNLPAILGEGLSAAVLAGFAYPVYHAWAVTGLCVLFLVAHAAGTLLILYKFLGISGLQARDFLQFRQVVRS
jgi:O-antigen/teichoic acid export membrane protein